MPGNPVDIPCRFNVDTTSYNVVQRRINVKTTPRVYREISAKRLPAITRKKNGNIHKKHKPANLRIIIEQSI